MTATRSFETGSELPALTVGPLTQIDLVRWAGYQENWLRIHYDNAYAAGMLGARDAVQSGHHRTALIVRTITDWLGDGGWVRRLSLRHAAPVLPGDTLTCGGRVRAVHGGSGGRQTIDLDVWAALGSNKKASEGTAVVELTLSDSGAARR